MKYLALFFITSLHAQTLKDFEKFKDYPYASRENWCYRVYLTGATSNSCARLLAPTIPQPEFLKPKPPEPVREPEPLPPPAPIATPAPLISSPPESIPQAETPKPPPQARPQRQPVRTPQPVYSPPPQVTPMPVQTTQPLPFYADPFELVFILLGVAAVIAGLIFYFRKPKLFDSPEAMGRHTVQNWDYNKSAEHMKVQTEKIAAANLMQNEVTISINAEAAIKLAEYNRQHILEETRIARELLMSEQVKNISQNNFDATRLRMMSSLLREAEQMGVTLEDLSAVRRKELENQVENRHDTEKQLLKLKILLLAKGIKDGSIREVDIGRELRGLHEGSDRGAGV